LIAVDTNILVFAHREELAKHERARGRLEELATGDEPWYLPIFCLAEFVRVVTHPRLFDPPSTREEALGALNALLPSPSLSVLYPGQRWWPIFQEAATEARVAGNLVFDAAIVALCLENGVRTILSEDLDFRRFKGIRLEVLPE
jgi:toxin-antitoxin system PIN domain toxin